MEKYERFVWLSTMGLSVLSTFTLALHILTGSEILLTLGVSSLFVLGIILLVSVVAMIIKRS